MPHECKKGCCQRCNQCVSSRSIARLARFDSSSLDYANYARYMCRNRGCILTCNYLLALIRGNTILAGKCQLCSPWMFKEAENERSCSRILQRSLTSRRRKVRRKKSEWHECAVESTFSFYSASLWRIANCGRVGCGRRVAQAFSSWTIAWIRETDVFLSTDWPF